MDHFDITQTVSPCLARAITGKKLEFYPGIEAKKRTEDWHKHGLSNALRRVLKDSNIKQPIPPNTFSKQGSQSEEKCVDMNTIKKTTVRNSMRKFRPTRKFSHLGESRYHKPLDKSSEK